MCCPPVQCSVTLLSNIFHPSSCKIFRVLLSNIMPTSFSKSVVLRNILPPGVQFHSIYMHQFIDLLLSNVLQSSFQYSFILLSRFMPSSCLKFCPPNAQHYVAFFPIFCRPPVLQYTTVSLYNMFLPFGQIFSLLLVILLYQTGQLMLLMSSM